MPKEYLIAIMAAIIFSGEDGQSSPEQAVRRALQIIRAVEQSKDERGAL